MDIELVERLESHMGQQDTQILLADCRKAAAEIRRIRAEQEAVDKFLAHLQMDVESGRIELHGATGESYRNALTIIDKQE